MMKRKMPVYLATCAILCAALTQLLSPARAQDSVPANFVATVPLYIEIKTGEYSLTRKEKTGDSFFSGSSMIGYVLKDSIPNAVPIYKLVNKGIKVFYSDGTTGNPTVYTTSKELAERLARDGFMSKDVDGKDFKYEYTLEGIICYIASKQVGESQPLYSSQPNFDGTFSSFAGKGGGGGIFGSDPTRKLKDLFGTQESPVIGYFWTRQEEVPRMALIRDTEIKPKGAPTLAPTPPPPVGTINRVNKGVVRPPRP